MTTGESTSVTTQQSVPTTLLDLFNNNDHYAVLNFAHSGLEPAANRLSVAMLAVRSYLALGLAGPARETLRVLADDPSSATEAAEIARRIETAPSGRLSWGGFQSRFERNIERLYGARPELQQHDATFRDLPRKLELYQSTDGNVHISKRVAAGGRRWLPDLCDADQLTNKAKLGHQPHELFCGPYLIVDDRRGLLFERVFRATSKMFLTFTPRIYFLQPDVRLFGVAMYLSECIEAWCDERVELFVGPDAHESLVEHFESHPKHAFPSHMLMGTMATDATLDQTLDRLRAMSDARVEHGRAVLAEVNRDYDALPPDYWHKRYTDGRPLRILGLTSRFTTYLQYSMRDCQAAFRRLGHEFKLSIEENDHDLPSSAYNAQEVARFKPDLILIIDHLRSEYRESLPTNVPYVCWIQDQLPNLISKEAGRSHGPLDFYIAPGTEHLVRSYEYPQGQGMAWTMATNERLFSADPMPESQLAAHRCDISFVSNQSRPPRVFHEEFVRTRSCAADVERLLEYLYEAIMRRITEQPKTAGCRSAKSLLEQAQRDLGIGAGSPEMQDSIAQQYIFPLTELAYRQATLEWAADYCDRTGRSLHLYGNGWSDHPRFSRYDRGFAENGQQLRAIYQASRINLQITTYGAVHQRLLDGLAAGGFFLIRYCPTDVIHNLVPRLLRLVNECDIVADRVYQTEDLPELADAWLEWRKLHGEDTGGSCLQIPEELLFRLRALASNRFRHVAGAHFERYGEVAFADATSFTAMVDRFLNNEDDRRELVSAMRPVVIDKFTYAAFVKDLLAFLQSRLAAPLNSSSAR